MAVKDIVVLRGGAIGDFIVTVPALAALRARWPGAQIELVAYPRVARLARAAGLADRFRSLDSAAMASLFDSGFDPVGEFAVRLAAADLVVSYLHDLDGVVGTNLVRVARGHVVRAMPDVGDGHAIEHLLGPLAAVGVTAPPGSSPCLRLPAAVLRQGRDMLAGVGRDVVVIHPGSGSPAKNWPFEHFAAVTRLLTTDGRTPLFVFGEADDAVRSAAGQMAPEVAVAPSMDLLELAAMLASCRAYLGNDSGITHLAAAVGARVVAFFGPSDPGAWGPRGRHVTILQARAPTAESLAELPPTCVIETLRALAKEA